MLTKDFGWGSKHVSKPGMDGWKPMCCTDRNVSEKWENRAEERQEGRGTQTFRERVAEAQVRGAPQPAPRGHPGSPDPSPG